MMAISARTSLLLVALVLAQQPARDTNTQPPPGTAVVAGAVVTDEKDPQPIRRARVVLSSGVRADNEIATSDDSGRFVFRGVPAGRYTLQANKAPFLPMYYGARRPERPGTPIAVAEGQTVSSLTIRMMRGAALEGRVFDQNGEPMAGVPVAAMRYGYSTVTGERALTAAANVTADDRGLYRAFGLAPGEYVVVARPPLVGIGRGATPDTRRLTAADVDRILQSGQAPEPARAMPGAPVSWSPVYHPGTAELGAAARIRLEAGEEQTGRDIPMRLVPTSRISGVVTTPGRLAPSSVGITIIPADPDSRISNNLGFVSTTRPDADGRFSFIGVTPGSFMVKARTGPGAAGRGRTAEGPAGSAEPVFWASADVTVEGRDLEVSLTMQPGIPVSGRVELKAATPLTPAEIAAIRIQLRASDSGPAITYQPSAAVTERGTFAFDGVVPGPFRFIWSSGAGRELFPTSVTIRGREILDGPVDITTPIADMVVALTDRPGDVTGTLQDASGRPATDYFMLVYSTNRAYWTPLSRRVMQTRPGNDGKYILRGLPAGEYFLSALTDLAPGDTSDSAFLGQLAATASKITVTDGATMVPAFRIGG